MKRFFEILVLVNLQNFMGFSIRDQFGATKQRCPIAQGANSRHVMAHKDYRPSTSGHITHLAEALLLESGITDCQHFINHQYFRFQVRRHREC